MVSMTPVMTHGLGGLSSAFHPASACEPGSLLVAWRVRQQEWSANVRDGSWLREYWKAAFQRNELLAAHSAACPMPSLLVRLAAPGCPKIGFQWDRCGVHYVDPIHEGG
jgi:hypothetical protein